MISSMRQVMFMIWVPLVFATAGCQTTQSGYPQNPPIMMFTDLGADSVAAGATKGAIYTHHPGARVDTLSNTVPAFNVSAGANLLAAGAETYPPGTIFLCMVSPDTNAGQTIIAMETNNGLRFVAPDNGLLTIVAERWGVRAMHACTNDDILPHGERSPVNLGREVLAPVAARWASGDDIASFGPARTLFKRIEVANVAIRGGSLDGTILWIDEFGNATTNVTIDHVRRARLSLYLSHGFDVRINNRWNGIPVVATYSDVAVEEALILFPPGGFMELAINQGNFAATYDVSAGDSISLQGFTVE